MPQIDLKIGSGMLRVILWFLFPLTIIGTWFVSVVYIEYLKTFGGSTIAFFTLFGFVSAIIGVGNWPHGIKKRRIKHLDLTSLGFVIPTAFVVEAICYCLMLMIFASNNIELKSVFQRYFKLYPFTTLAFIITFVVTSAVKTYTIEGRAKLRRIPARKRKMRRLL
jgi:hypothetical protein